MSDVGRTGQMEADTAQKLDLQKLTENHHTGLSFSGLKLSGFERQLITGNRCEAFLNMKCVFHPDSMDIYYDAERYLHLGEVLRSGMTGLDTVLVICREFLEALKVCEDYLLSEGDLSFQDEHLFCAEDLTAVKFMYIPGYRNAMSIREKLIDIIDTVIEYDEGEDRKVSCLSDYKNRLYTGGQDLKSLSILTEDTIRKNGSEQRTPLQMAEQTREGSENRKREKGTPVRFPVPEQSPFRNVNSGKITGFLQEEGEAYGTRDEQSGSSPRFGKKLKSLFNDLVS